MTLPEGEPTSTEAIASWVEAQTEETDRFAHVRAVSEGHRDEHGCDVYPTRSGPLLGVLAAARRAERVLEVGTGLGYSALWLASASGAHVTTIERDADHARLARKLVGGERYGDRIEIVHGEARNALDDLFEPYDVCFFDAEPAVALVCLPHFVRLMEPGALLISANLFLGRHDPEMPGLDQTAGYRERILEDPRFLTAFVPSGLALSVRVK